MTSLHPNRVPFASPGGLDTPSSELPLGASLTASIKIPHRKSPPYHTPSLLTLSTPTAKLDFYEETFFNAAGPVGGS